ncbi:MAG: prepilin peptidase [Gemmataceae bacterium]
MANDLSAAPPVTAPSPDDLGLDRAFLMSMARIPFLAVLWAAAAVVVSAVIEQFGWHVIAADKQFNLGPLVVIAFGMLLAAFIDGYAFKVPNWCTLSLVMSGWYLGLLHDLGYQGAPGGGGVGAAVAGTFLGFALLFPALFVGGMGQGDVKMTMGFGSWVAAYFGLADGAWVLFWSFAVGVLVGGVFGLVMMACRRQFYKNWSNAREVLTDLQVMVAVGPKAAASRANSRRKDWVRLPYGVPLCVGFLGYLVYIFFIAN